MLATLDTIDLEASLAQAKVSLNQAKLNQIQANSNLATAQFNLDKIQAVGELKNKILKFLKANLKLNKQHSSNKVNILGFMA